jgi:GNAT superfamily N-acetyltransferase
MTGPYRVERPTSVDEFVALAGDFLQAHEAENNLMLGLSGNLARTPGIFPNPPRFAVALRTDGSVAGCTLQTPPWQAVIGYGGDLEAVDVLADALADDELPGVNGAVDLAARFARRWATVTGDQVEIGLAERIHRLATVRAARPTTGSMRLARPGDEPLIAEWLVAFAAEALAETFDDANEVAARMVAGVNRALYFWEDGGEPVSMSGVGSPTAHGARVGPVYTPPDRRSRGYASNLVAACSQAELDKGLRFVFLYTDLANPTSNKIYADVGYEPVLDVQLYRFSR